MSKLLICLIVSLDSRVDVNVSTKTVLKVPSFFSHNVLIKRKTHFFITGFDPVLVSRHRLNIAELSKLEHDMYLMGVAMTCLDNSEETNRQKERQRTRIKYRFMVIEIIEFQTYLNFDFFSSGKRSLPECFSLPSQHNSSPVKKYSKACQDKWSICSNTRQSQKETS